jgi:hypothetical protein
MTTLSREAINSKIELHLDRCIVCSATNTTIECMFCSYECYRAYNKAKLIRRTIGSVEKNLSELLAIKKRQKNDSRAKPETQQKAAQQFQQLDQLISNLRMISIFNSSTTEIDEVSLQLKAKDLTEEFTESARLIMQDELFLKKEIDHLLEHFEVSDRAIEESILILSSELDTRRLFRNAKLNLHEK